MTHTEMLNRLIETGERMRKVQKEFETVKPVWASAIIKKRERKVIAEIEFDNSIFNIKQFLK